MTKKNVLIPVVAAALLFFSATGTASAQVNTGGVTSLVNNLLGSLNLTDTEVESVLELALSADQAAVRAELDAKLSEAVVEGEISVSQKQAIMDKLDELRAQAESLDVQNLTDDQLEEVLQLVETDLLEWADLNDVDLDLLVDLSLSIAGVNANVGLSL